MSGVDLLKSCLTLNPAKRISAAEAANHMFFDTSACADTSAARETEPASAALGTEPGQPGSSGVISGPLCYYMLSYAITCYYNSSGRQMLHLGF